MPKQTSKSDAIDLLTADHDAVLKLFDDFEDLGEKAFASKGKLAKQICQELTIHSELEEEIFYPAVREAIDDDDLMDEADIEHAAAKDLIAQIEAMSPEESHFDAKVKVLGEEIEHHVEEEQEEMFKKVRASDLDTMALGELMVARKESLKQALV